MNSVDQKFPLIIFSPPLVTRLCLLSLMRWIVGHVLVCSAMSFFVVSHAHLMFIQLLWLHPLCLFGSKTSWGTDYLTLPSAAQGACRASVPLWTGVKIHKPVVAPLPHITWLHFLFSHLLLGLFNVSSCFLDKHFVSRAKKQWDLQRDSRTRRAPWLFLRECIISGKQ